MTVWPWTRRLYIRRYGKPVVEEKPHVINSTTAVSIRIDASRGFKERQNSKAAGRPWDRRRDGSEENDEESGYRFSTLDKALLGEFQCFNVVYLELTRQNYNASKEHAWP